jgi:hypothetical protein
MAQDKNAAKPGSNAPKPMAAPVRQDQGKGKEKDSADKSKKNPNRSSQDDSHI